MDQQYPPVPPDNAARKLTVAQVERDKALSHIGIAGDTYTITVSGEDTADRFCVIDMHIPPGGGPAPHRHDFEESFILLEGELAVTCRGEQSTVKAGTTVNVPANAPHRFHNRSSAPVRLLCICAPAGQDRFFREVGVPVGSRTEAPPALDEAGQAVFREKAASLAPKYRTELLENA